MKITNVPRESAQTVEQARPTQSKGKADSVGKKGIPSFGQTSHSDVEISEGAQMMNQALDTARRAPDANLEKVAALKKAILEGTYQVSSEDVADKLLDQHLNIHFGKNNL